MENLNKRTDAALERWSVDEPTVTTADAIDEAIKALRLKVGTIVPLRKDLKSIELGKKQKKEHLEACIEELKRLKDELT